ncbi:neuroepithelial cell-transforming gene 1 protein-like isoform X2 [Physella acuta]|uniref:neuroepithelial cell-transforming gene 1 protein-like isoform X2 n=1 Tax=Physella acuta TaxID=109671 RepID=UPI0027DDE708|nr:neuroepithelial cell-transforming gene 1 protein-like isoform X2 [Physella acuta]XP_059144613.1 neuroepithelial cell-transforming gene 1 protein-like isoform X2 [Physella acuta]XP_059144615.1 neuroepithelial cell-transforming gene 1 protein-like isoform X2 [Physella acuta]
MDEQGLFKVPLTCKSSRRLSFASGFELPRFRKRKLKSENNEDNISVTSLNVSGISAKKKSKQTLRRVSASLVNLISPGRQKHSVVLHHKKQLENNMPENKSFKVPCSPRPQVASPYKLPHPSPAKRRQQLTWMDTLGGASGKSLLQLTSTDIKRQEAIYELFQGERDMVEDLLHVTKLYRDSLLTLGLMSNHEVNTLFGNIDQLIPVHQELSRRLQEEREPDGTTRHVGKQIYDWDAIWHDGVGALRAPLCFSDTWTVTEVCSNIISSSQLSVYITYCANQIQAKSIFDTKKNEPAIEDFFQRCLASPFSRKLDLWSLLDGAKGRFVKYPLLIHSILKYTTSESDDAAHLKKAIKRMEKMVGEADLATGVSRCEHSKSLLTYLYDDQKVAEIELSTALLCSGCMKNSKGSKLYVFLFDKVVVVSRSSFQSSKQLFQVYRQPIPTGQLIVEDLPDGVVKMGSFRNAFGQGGHTAKNMIRLSFQDAHKGHSHTLIANDEHDKRQWMQAFHKVTSKIVVVPEVQAKAGSDK